MLIGVKSANEAYEKYKEAKMMFEKASMNLREWNSNSIDFLNSIAVAECVNGDISKVFGLLWNCIDDIIFISGPDNTIQIVLLQSVKPYIILQRFLIP